MYTLFKNIHISLSSLTQRYHNQKSQLYLFSDVLVTGTKIKPPGLSKKPHPKVKIEVTPDQEMESADEGSTNESPEVSDESAASSDHSDHEHVEEEEEEQEHDKMEKEKERETEQDQVDRCRALQKNPYAGHLENQCISRLTQVQADIIEDSGKWFLFIILVRLCHAIWVVLPINGIHTNAMLHYAQVLTFSFPDDI